MPYENFIRTCITDLQIVKDVSEHRMSLERGKKWVVYLWSSLAFTQRVFLKLCRILIQHFQSFLHHWGMRILSTTNFANTCRCSVDEIVLWQVCKKSSSNMGLSCCPYSCLDRFLTEACSGDRSVSSILIRYLETSRIQGTLLGRVDDLKILIYFSHLVRCQSFRRN